MKETVEQRKRELKDIIEINELKEDGWSNGSRQSFQVKKIS
jgi:hypothetical protein